MSILNLKNIHIKEFKSIDDSTLIHIDDRITVLAGKNESGKTSILKALEKFSNDSFDEDDVPNKVVQTNPTVVIEYETEGKNLKNIISTLNDSALYNFIIERSKDESDVISGTLVDAINGFIDKKLDTMYDDISEEEKNNLNILYEQLFDAELELKNIGNFLKRMINYNNSDNIESLEKYLLEENIIDVSNKKELIDKFEKSIKDTFFEIIEAIDKISNIFPDFVYFDDFKNMLPDEIEYEKINDVQYQQEHMGFIYLLDYLGVSIEEFVKIASQDKRVVSRRLSELSKNFSGYFNNIYKQENIRIELKRDGSQIMISLFDENSEVDTKPSQRSKGFQWFFSFFLMVEAQKGKNSILLIDEPGLFLHSSAQEDILNIFETKLDNYILYTTHSPFLIDTNNTHRIKLVQKDESSGSYVINKYYASGDLETVAPIISAIGYNICRSPVDFGSGLNIITEGISDRYYLLAFKELFNVTKNVCFIPSIGASKTVYLASIAQGWNLDYKVLLDNDSGGTDALKNLKKLYLTDYIDKYVVRVPMNNKGTIESVFSHEDGELTWHSSPECNKDKTLTALEFYNKVKSREITKTSLSENTIANIEDLLKRLTIL